MVAESTQETTQKATDNSAEIFRLSLPMMTQHRVPITPHNYAVWYSYVASEFPKLVKEIDRLKTENKRFDEEVNQALYNKFVSECDEAQFGNAREVLATIITEISSLLSTAGTDATTYGNHLTGFVDHVDQDPPDTNNISTMMRGLIEETRHMCESTVSLKEHFNDKSRQIEELQEELQRERKKSQIDPLTGIANRLAMFEALHEAITSSDQPPSVLMIDIDNFKKVNDSFGHLVGDRVIRFVASILSKATKGQDTAARYGGEEFVVVLPQTPLEGALVLAEKIRKAISEARLVRSDTKEPLGQVTVSIGASLHQPEKDVSDTLDRADRALYLSKENGRNRVASETALSAP